MKDYEKTIGYEKLKLMDSDRLKDAAKELINLTSEEADLALEICLSLLERSLPELDFIAFCESL